MTWLLEKLYTLRWRHGGKGWKRSQIKKIIDSNR